MFPDEAPDQEHDAHSATADGGEVIATDGDGETNDAPVADGSQLVARRDVDPDLSQAARALAAFVSERDNLRRPVSGSVSRVTSEYVREPGEVPVDRPDPSPETAPDPLPELDLEVEPALLAPSEAGEDLTDGEQDTNDGTAADEVPGDDAPADEVPAEPRAESAPALALTFGGTPTARVALVTGAGRGIGRAIALGLGRAGLSVALLGRSPEALEEVAAEISSYGVGASWAGADVRDYAQVHAAVERLEAALGEIDLLVNNAGVIEPAEVPVWDAGPETWWHVVETDLRGPFHCVRAVVPGMVERGGGRVVNLSSSIGAVDRDIYSAYAAAKAGQFRITGSLHQAGYGRGIRAFEVSPGTVRTDMTATMAVHAGRSDWTPVERVVELVVAVAGGRLDAWSGGFLRAGVDTLEALDTAELEAGEAGLPPSARRLGVLPYGPDDPLNLAPAPLSGRLPGVSTYNQ